MSARRRHRHTPGNPVPTGVEADTLSAATAAEGTEDVLETAVPGGTGPASGESCAAGRHLADRVVLLALGRVGEHRMGLADLLELLLGHGVTGVLVRVVLPGELAVGLLIAASSASLGTPRIL